MKIYEDNDSVYVPLNFATDLFSNENILQGAYNNKDLFIFNFTENEDISMFGRTYYEGMYANPLSKEYSTFIYNELCLDSDILLGRPGRSSLEIYYDLSKGLDNALNSRPLGKTIIKYLKSDQLDKFLAGATLFGYLHNDGGHSGYAPLNVSYIEETTKRYVRPSWLSDDLINRTATLVSKEIDKNYEEIINYDVPFNQRAAVRKNRSDKLNKPNGALKGYDTYTKEDNIAYIHIDGFMGEIELQDEWNKYYKGQRDSIPFGENIGGAVGAIYNGVIKASKDDQIKHVVIDLASNTGGSTDEMLFMIALLTGSKKAYTYNNMSKNYNIATYDFDFNLDRVFDEKDDEMLTLLEDKDISVLTSKNGFSCGGISPIYLQMKVYLLSEKNAVVDLVRFICNMMDMVISYAALPHPKVSLKIRSMSMSLERQFVIIN